MSGAFDVIVVGAGPGGIAAAAVAAEAGLRVCLLDDNPAPGGQIWRGFRPATALKHPHGYTYLRWIDRLQKTGCTVWCGWQVTDCPAASLLRVERDGKVQDLHFRTLIVATGARERFLPFPGWTLPGVMGAGGAQALVKAGLDARGRRVVVAGTGPLLLAVAAGLTDAGAMVASIYEQAPLSRLIRFGLTLMGQPKKLAEGARYRLKTRGAPFRTGCWVVRAEGSERVEHVVVTDGRQEWRERCEWLACGFHLVPNLELPRLLGCRIKGGLVEVDALRRSSVEGVCCVGELTGVGGIEKALLEGEIAALAASGNEDRARALAKRLDRKQRFARRLECAFTLRDELRTLAAPETLVCRCEDVTQGAMQACGSWREAKMHTRCGMGACQGRVCGAAAEFLYGWQTGGARPPVFPTAVATVATPSKAQETIHSS